MSKKYYQEHKEQIKEKAKKWRETHQEQYRENIRRYNQNRREEITAYHRIHSLGTNGKVYHGLNKRPYPYHCEICGTEHVRLNYHHWDDNNMNLGIWVCQSQFCHGLLELDDRGLIFERLEIYHRLRELINKVEVDQIVH